LKIQNPREDKTLGESIYNQVVLNAVYETKDKLLKNIHNISSKLVSVEFTSFIC